jgi:mono/diheme cytochrome c family protein
LTLVKDRVPRERVILESCVQEVSMMRPHLPIVAVTLLFLAGAVPWTAWAAEPDLEAGKALAERYCGNCHAVGPIGDSRLPAAPPLRDVAERYSVWNLEEALAEGIVTGHAEMPLFVFKPVEITNLLSYMETLARKKPVEK